MARLLLKIVLATKKLSSLAPILVKLTGKSKEAIHPKHLIYIENPWFLRELTKKDIVLDLGCGNGQNTIKAAKVCKKIIGIDNNKKQLGIGIREQRRYKIKNLKFFLANLEKIKFKYRNSSFDAVLILDVLEHLNNRDSILQEIYRILKKDGKLLLSVPNKNTSWKKKLKKAGLFFYADPGHKIEYSYKEICKELKNSKFTIEKIMPIVYDFPLVGIIDLIGSLSLFLYKWLTIWKQKKVITNPEETTGFRIVCQKLTNI